MKKSSEIPAACICPVVKPVLPIKDPVLFALFSACVAKELKAISNTAAPEVGCPRSSKADAVTPEPFLGINFISKVFGSPSFS